MDAWQNIKNKKYEVTDENLLSRAFSYNSDKPTTKEDMREAKREYNIRMSALRSQFKADLEKEFQTENHPKADSLFAMAWDRGHSAGYHEVYLEYEELVELIK
jgi:hypothetical protein